MTEYGWTIEYAMEVPIRQALCLHSAIALRHGYTWGEASYVQREMNR